CSLSLNVPGDHNILNALATIAVCDLSGVDADKAAKGIETFKGTHRRFEKKGFLNGAVVIDDYAHHPTEIKATLAAAKKFNHNKIWCVFQPHTYSRTRTLWKEFTEAFDNTDELILTHIYAAREKFDGVTKPEDLTEDIKKRGISARYIDKFDDIAAFLKENVKEGDIVFTMGAGDVVNINELICE
ncbi:MAG: UDP-N-acetylmuramate--L-alanine ligase, partial [Clostridia bacterium]|nr:UDP-N-acetylmuramate--L-alanine ligase [Clostridia bacterium]